jgi:hypothetical protein
VREEEVRMKLEEKEEVVRCENLQFLSAMEKGRTRRQKIID